MENQELTGKIIGCAIKVHSVLGPGYLESVYGNALAYELQKSGLQFESKKVITVIYEGQPVGDFCADKIVEQKIIIEEKAVTALAVAHEPN